MPGVTPGLEPDPAQETFRDRRRTAAEDHLDVDAMEVRYRRRRLELLRQLYEMKVLYRRIRLEKLARMREAEAYGLTSSVIEVHGESTVTHFERDRMRA